jgi:hypothetical protein
MDKRNNLKFIIEKDILCKTNEIKALYKGLNIVDKLPNKDINEIFLTERRDGVRSRLKSKLKSFF